MGNNLSISEADLENLASSTKYSPEQIKRMYNKFSQLSKEGNYVSVEDLKAACEVENTEVS